MSWGKIDDRLDDSPKFAGIDPAAAGLWLLCQPQALRRGDGFVPEGVPTRFAQGRGSHAASVLVAILVERGLWDIVDGGWVYHDFAEYQKLSGKRSEAGSKGAATRWQRDGKPMAKDASRDGLTPIPEPVPIAKAITPKPPSGDVAAVWQAWVTSTGRTACKLDEKRKRLIVARLNDYPLADVLAAVQGWVRDPWEGRRQQNELAILLRDNAHLEKFRDLWLTPVVVGRDDKYADVPRNAPGAISLAYQQMSRASTEEEKALARQAILAAQSAAGMAAHG